MPPLLVLTAVAVAKAPANMPAAAPFSILIFNVAASGAALGNLAGLVMCNLSEQCLEKLGHATTWGWLRHDLVVSVNRLPNIGILAMGTPRTDP